MAFREGEIFVFTIHFALGNFRVGAALCGLPQLFQGRAAAQGRPYNAYCLTVGPRGKIEYIY